MSRETDLLCQLFSLQSYLHPEADTGEEQPHITCVSRQRKLEDLLLFLLLALLRKE